MDSLDDGLQLYDTVPLCKFAPRSSLYEYGLTTISKLAGTPEEQELDNIPTKLPVPDDDPIERDLFVPIAVRHVDTRGQLSA